MIKYIFIVLFYFLNTGCWKQQHADNIDALLELDKRVLIYPSLTHFSNFKFSRKNINDFEVCSDLESKCIIEEEKYSNVLKRIDVPILEFDSFQIRISEIDYKAYYRYGDYSIWVKDGAFGDIYGILINHNPDIPHIAPFVLNKRYYIEIGKKVRPNVYYFSSNLYWPRLIFSSSWSSPSPLQRLFDLE